MERAGQGNADFGVARHLFLSHTRVFYQWVHDSLEGATRRSRRSVAKKGGVGVGRGEYGPYSIIAVLSEPKPRQSQSVSVTSSSSVSSSFIHVSWRRDMFKKACSILENEKNAPISSNPCPEISLLLAFNG